MTIISETSVFYLSKEQFASFENVRHLLKERKSKDFNDLVDRYSNCVQLHIGFDCDTNTFIAFKPNWEGCGYSYIISNLDFDKITDVNYMVKKLYDVELYLDKREFVALEFEPLAHCDCLLEQKQFVPTLDVGRCYFYTQARFSKQDLEGKMVIDDNRGNVELVDVNTDDEIYNMLQKSIKTAKIKKYEKIISKNNVDYYMITTNTAQESLYKIENGKVKKVRMRETITLIKSFASTTHM